VLYCVSARRRGFPRLHWWTQANYVGQASHDRSWFGFVGTALSLAVYPAISAFSPGGNPEFVTVLKVVRALGIKHHAEPEHV
jgi:hypothetical protein